MIRLNVRVTINTQALIEKHRRSVRKAQLVLDEQVIKDSNYYAPEDRGELIRSALRASTIGEGLVRWSTPYVRKLYYNPDYNFSTDMNPNAGGLWFETAKAAKLPIWINLAKEAYRREFN